MHRSAAVLLAILGLAAPSIAASWTESVNGDISGNRLIPSILTLDLGANAVAGSFGSGDLDYLRIDIPAGRQLSAINVIAYSGPSVSFIGVQSGTTFTVTPSTATAASQLGYGHFGSANLTTNILPAIGTGAGATGFTPPLSAGSYTFWLQELGATTSYSLNFVTIPSPASMAPLAMGLLLLRRRR